MDAGKGSFVELVGGVGSTWVSVVEARPCFVDETGRCFIEGVDEDDFFDDDFDDFDDYMFHPRWAEFEAEYEREVELEVKADELAVRTDRRVAHTDRRRMRQAKRGEQCSEGCEQASLMVE